MIEKGKVVHFYSWLKEGKKIQVIGEMTKTAGLVFSFYVNKEKLEDPNGELSREFVTELKYAK